MRPLLDAALWANLQVALLTAALVIPAVGASRLLRGAMPVWRKCLWFGVMLIPFVMAAAGLMLPSARTWLLPGTKLAPASAGGAPAGAGAHDAAWIAGTLAYTLYGAWVAGSLIFELATWLRLREVLGRAHDVRGPSATVLYNQLAKRVGCWRAPRLVVSDEVTSPFVVATLWRGMTIVLPESLATTGDADGDEEHAAMRAVLAHELAHARAGDPWLQRLVFLARCFVPLAWVCGLGAARAFWEDAAEQAGDLRAVRGSGLSARRYGTVLKDLALGADAAMSPAAALGFHPAAAANFSPAARALARAMFQRLGALPLAARWSEGAAMGVGACLRAALGLGVLTFVARNATSSPLVADPRGHFAAEGMSPSPSTSHPTAGMRPDRDPVPTADVRPAAQPIGASDGPPATLPAPPAAAQAKPATPGERMVPASRLPPGLRNRALKGDNAKASPGAGHGPKHPKKNQRPKDDDDNETIKD